MRRYLRWFLPGLGLLRPWSGVTRSLWAQWLNRQRTAPHPPAPPRRLALCIELVCSLSAGLGAVLFTLLASNNAGELFQRLHYGLAALSCALLGGYWGLQTLLGYRHWRRNARRRAR